MQCNIVKIVHGTPDLIKENGVILEFPSRVEAEEYIIRNNILFAVPTDVSGVNLGTIVDTLFTSFLEGIRKKK